MKGKGDGNGPGASSLTGKALERGYDHAVHRLDRDAEILDQMRTRASFLIAALAVGGTVLAAILSMSANVHLQPALPVLLGLLGSAILLCIGILWPTRDHGDLPQKLPDDAPRSFCARWGEWWNGGHLKKRPRLWQVGLGSSDLENAQRQAYKSPEWVDQFLLRRMYLAHDSNNNTLTRRADLFRAASLLVLAFVIAFSAWLPFITTSSTPAGSTSAVTHSSPTPTVTVTVTVTP